MATAIPLHFVPLAVPPRSVDGAEGVDDRADPAQLTAEERAAYEAGGFFRGFVDVVLDEEQENPGGAERVRAAREGYGDDVERERTDLEAGRHPFQKPR